VGQAAENLFKLINFRLNGKSALWIIALLGFSVCLTDQQVTGDGDGQELESHRQEDFDACHFQTQINPEADKDEDEPHGHALTESVTSAQGIGKAEDPNR
jgi:hypothetical protein